MILARFGWLVLRLLAIALLGLALGAAIAPAFARSLCSTVTKTTSVACAGSLTTDQCFTLAISGCANGLGLDGSSTAVTASTVLVKVTGTGTTGGILICSPGGDAGGSCESANYGASFVTTISNFVTRGGRLVQFTWGVSSTAKVFAGNAGILAHLARAATAVNWIATSANGVRPSGQPAAWYGQSGGAQQIAAALMFYGSDGDIDMAIVSSGPPMANLRYLCHGNGALPWATYCAAHSNSSGVCKAGGESGVVDAAWGAATVCTVASMSGGLGNPGQLDSLDRPDRKTSFPTLDLHHYLGDHDTSAAYPLGQYWWNQLGITAKTTTQHIVVQINGHNHTEVPNDSASSLDTVLQTLVCNRSGCP